MLQAWVEKDRFHLPDLRNARRVVKRHGRTWSISTPGRRGLSGWQRWAEDQTGEAVRRVKETQDSLLQVGGQANQGADQEGGETTTTRQQIGRSNGLARPPSRGEDTRAIGPSGIGPVEARDSALPDRPGPRPVPVQRLNGTSTYARADCGPIAARTS